MPLLFFFVAVVIVVNCQDGIANIKQALSNKQSNVYFEDCCLAQAGEILKDLTCKLSHPGVLHWSTQHMAICKGHSRNSIRGSATQCQKEK